MQLHEKLRQPEFQKRRNKQSLRLLLEEGTLDIARPFPAWRLPKDPDWREDPYSDDTWGLYYHSLGWLAILDYGVDNAQTPGESRECNERLRALLFSYMEFLASEADDQLPKMVWFDHATAWRASAIAYFVERRFKGDLTDREAALVNKVVQQHESKLREYIESGRWNANNHGLFHAEALWDLVQVFEVVPAEVKEIALSHMRTVFSTMIDLEEGVCREHSIYYHLFDAWLLAESARYMRAFDIEVVSGYADVLRKMVRFYEDFAGGGEQLHAVGDTQYGRKRASTMLDEIRAAAGMDIDDGGREEDVPRYRAYPRNGYYFFRSGSGPGPDSAFAILLDKPYVGAHGHFDGGSFTIDYGGKPVVVDCGGPFAYGKELRFNYFKAAEAHNVVVFGKNSRPYKTQVTSAVQAATGSAVRLSAVDLEGIEWRRTFVALEGGAFVVIDDVDQAEKAVCHAVLHLAPGLQPTRVGPGHYALSMDGIRPEVLLVSSAELDCQIGGGDAGFPRGLITRELGKAESAPVISAGFHEKRAWLVTVISPVGVSNVMVHTLYAGKLLRITFVDGPSPVVVDCNMTDPDAQVRIHAFRDHRWIKSKDD